jgi:hypothetical protein
MFRHPKYYKELRKLRNKLDQAISDSTSCSGADSVRPDPGLQVTSHKLPGPRPISNANKGLIHKLQASSSKRVKQQATSVKPQAKRFKLQATSFKRQDP